MTVLVDVLVIDTDAQSHTGLPVHDFLATAELKKKQNYSIAVEDRRASCTPFMKSIRIQGQYGQYGTSSL